MRSYLTRHGDGYMPESQLKMYVNAPQETNGTNKYQGNFRKAPHSSQLIQYALECDKLYHPSIFQRQKHLIITCLDQTNDEICIDEQLIPFELFDSSYTGDPLLNMISFTSSEQTL